jgi:hypothetical protein
VLFTLCSSYGVVWWWREGNGESLFGKDGFLIKEKVEWLAIIGWSFSLGIVVSFSKCISLIANPFKIHQTLYTHQRKEEVKL